MVDRRLCDREGGGRRLLQTYFLGYAEVDVAAGVLLVVFVACWCSWEQCGGGDMMIMLLVRHPGRGLWTTGC